MNDIGSNNLNVNLTMLRSICTIADEGEGGGEGVYPVPSSLPYDTS